MRENCAARNYPASPKRLLSQFKLDFSNSLFQQQNQHNTRLFCNYYRVGMYGSKFGEDLDGKEFIYREPPFVRISDLTERLKVCCPHCLLMTSLSLPLIVVALPLMTQFEFNCVMCTMSTEKLW